MAILALGEMISPMLPLSLALVVGGALLLVPRKEGSDGYGIAIPLTMAVAVMWGANQVIRKSAIDSGMGVLTFLWISVLSAAIFLNLTAGMMSSWTGQRLNGKSVGLSVLSGLVGHLMGNFCYLTALGMEKVSTLAPFISATIPFGFMLSILIVGEKPTGKSVVGMVVIFSGVILAAL
jgi:drug/metabolite transporter (DMT)-like permease